MVARGNKGVVALGPDIIGGPLDITELVIMT